MAILVNAPDLSEYGLDVLFLSLHALARMKARSISRDEIKAALANPDTNYPSEDHPDARVVILGSTLAGRRLKVVVEVADRECVVTVCDRDEEE